MKKRTNVVFGLEPVCNRCTCRAFLLAWAEQLSDESKIWPLDELADIEQMIYGRLCRVAQCCVVPEFKKYAEAQLKDERWDNWGEEQSLQ